MKLKDITKEQAIEIAKLSYPFLNLVKSEYEFHYQPYDASWYEDAAEFIRISFMGILAADKVVPLQLKILPQLDCVMYWFNEKENMLDYFPLRNQYAIQKKFMEWGIEPEYTNK